jgi:hypothetical protein
LPAQAHNAAEATLEESLPSLLYQISKYLTLLDKVLTIQFYFSVQSTLWAWEYFSLQSNKLAS